MAFCCCKKSKHVEDGEAKEVQTGLLHSQEEHEQPSTTLKMKKPAPIVSMRMTGRVEVGERHATGVAKLPGSIYVLCKNPSSIVIHRDASPFDCTDEVSLEDLEAPYDLASNISSSCLYLTDCTTNCVYKMTSPTHEVSPWLKDIGYPHTLTVTSPKVEVLLLRYGSPSSLEIYGTDAVKVRSVQLPDEIEYPKHAVRNSGGNYVVSGKAKGVVESWGVFEMTVDGEILRRLTESNDLTESNHLTIDSADRLFVADCLKHRLLVVDAQLSRSEELLPNENKKLRWPWRLHYSANDKQVLVLQCNFYMFRGVANGEKDASEEKTKERTVDDGIGLATVEDTKTQDGGQNETEKASTVEEKKAGAEEEEEKDEEEKATANGTVTEKDDEYKKIGDEEKEKKGEEKDQKDEEKDQKDEEKDQKDEEKDQKDEEKDQKDEEKDQKDEEEDKKDEEKDKKAEENDQKDEEKWEQRKKAGKHHSVVYIYSYV